MKSLIAIILFTSMVSFTEAAETCKALECVEKALEQYQRVSEDNKELRNEVRSLSDNLTVLTDQVETLKSKNDALERRVTGFDDWVYSETLIEKIDIQYKISDGRFSNIIPAGGTTAHKFVWQAPHTTAPIATVLVIVTGRQFAEMTYSFHNVDHEKGYLYMHNGSTATLERPVDGLLTVKITGFWEKP